MANNSAPKNQLNSVLTEVEKLIASKNWNIAQPLLRQLCQNNPRNADIPAQIGMFFQSRNMPVKAEMFYLESLKINNHQATLHFNLGLIYQMLNKLEAARNAYRTAIEIQPDYARAHANLGYVYRELNDRDNATKSFQESIRLQPDDPQIRHMMAAAGIVETPAIADQDYVKNTFDGYAEYYDEHLLIKLKSRTPQLVFEAVMNCLEDSQKKLDILDLGCGTGLCGELFKDISDTMTGVDLSEKMIHKAKERNIYTKLIIDDISRHTKMYHESFDAVIASDVFIYIGELGEIFSDVFNALRPGALFVFTIEALKNRPDNYILEHSGRYQHNDDYIRKLAKTTGFNLIYSNAEPLREQNGVYLDGYVYSLKKQKEGVRNFV